MTKPSDEEIRAAYDMLDDGDASIEKLLQMVCDHFDGNIDHGDVATALADTAK